MPIPIQYIGKRQTYQDGAYGSRINFVRGETMLVPDDIALKMLKHPDVYERGDFLKAEVPPVVQLSKLSETEDTLDLRDEIMRMDSETIITKVMNEYQVKLDKRQGAPKLRERYVALIDQYGAV